MSKVLTLIPAYSHSYPSLSAAKADFLAGRTFKTREGTHLTIRDTVARTIRIKLPTQSIVFTIPPPSRP